MEGAMLLGIYSIVAVSYWLYPDSDIKLWAETLPYPLLKVL